MFFKVSNINVESSGSERSAYLVTLRYVAFNNRQDVMQVDSSGLTVPEAHDVTQEKPIRLLFRQAVDLEGL